MFENLKLTPKIIGSIVATLLVTSVAGFFITEHLVNKQAEDAFVDKLRKTDSMADKVRVYFSANVDLFVPNHQFRTFTRYRSLSPGQSPANTPNRKG